MLIIAGIAIMMLAMLVWMLLFLRQVPHVFMASARSRRCTSWKVG
jgi:hypothetical protein